MFGTRHIYYIVSEPMGWEVPRRSSDFKWLSERLSREFPQIQVQRFDGHSTKDVEVFINKIIENDHLRGSQFLAFFLNCTNTKRFYDRRKVEYNNSWIKDAKVKINNIMEGSSAVNAAKDASNKITTAAGQLQASGEDMKRHAFLEDATNFMKLNTKAHGEIMNDLTQIGFHLEQLINKLVKVGNLMEQLRGHQMELEKHNVKAITELNPKPSEVYDSIKSMFYRWANSFQVEKQDFKKMFEPRLGNILSRNEKLVEKLKVRKGIVKSMQSGPKPAKSGITADDAEKKLTPEERMLFKESKLLNTNHLLYLECTESLRQEVIDMQLALKDFSQATVQSLERDRTMWVEIMEGSQRLNQRELRI